MFVIAMLQYSGKTTSLESTFDSELFAWYPMHRPASGNDKVTSLLTENARLREVAFFWVVWADGGQTLRY